MSKHPTTIAAADDDDKGGDKGDVSMMETVDPTDVADKKKVAASTDDDGRSSPFLDAFWSLADESGEKRARAARCLLTHCFGGDTVHRQDACYALRRLLDGLNSGRACARQGFASCLSSFLKLACADPVVLTAMLHDFPRKFDDQDAMTDGDDVACAHEFIRRELLDRTGSHTDNDATTTSKKKKKKGSDERDYAFGRLFGILAVSRSGILDQAPSQVVEGYLRDLFQLLRWRKWMREPCAHAVIEFLASLSSAHGKSSVENVVVPEFLRPEFDNKQNYSPEGVGIRLYVERKFGLLPFDGRPLLSATTDDDDDDDDNNTEALCTALLGTASVTTIGTYRNSTAVLRRHMVWTQLLQLFRSYEERLFASDEERRADRTNFLAFLFKDFVEGRLLTSATAERRTLALALVLEYTTCRDKDNDDTLVPLPSSSLETYVLSPSIVRKLFLHTLSATKGHILKEMAAQVLRVVVDANVTSSSSSDTLSFLKAFLRAEPKFDTRTKSDSLARLVTSLNSKEEVDSLVDFLEEEILTLAREDGAGNAQSIEGMTEFLSNLHKTIAASAATDTTFAHHVRDRAVRFFMAGSFFDCRDVARPNKSKKQRKKPKEENTVLTAARKIQTFCSKKKTTLPYHVRRTLSSRFFSLLSECVVSAPYRQNKDEDVSMSTTNKTTTTNKTEHALRVLGDITTCWDTLEQNKAKLYAPLRVQDDDDDDDEEEVRTSTTKLQQLAREQPQEGPASRVVLGCATLSVSLLVQLLRCGRDDNDELLPDEDDDDHEEEEEEGEAIEELMRDLSHANKAILSLLDPDTNMAQEEEEADKEVNPLALLADVCSSTLSLFESSSSSNGRSTRMLRDTAKMAWSGCLVAAASSDHSALAVDGSVMEVLLDAVCDADPTEGETEEEDGEDGDNEVFTAAIAAGLDTEEDVDQRSVEEEEDEEKVETSAPNEDEEDVELNSDQLQNLLLEDNAMDSDDDDDNGFQLEHHAGADKALAQLIKLKRDTRKKAKGEQERRRNTHRLRCLPLLEVVFSTHGNGGAHDSGVFRDGNGGALVLSSLLPLLRTRRRLERAVSAAEQHGKKGGASHHNNNNNTVGEKKALVERLTVVFKNRICKTKVLSQEKAEDVKLLAVELLAEARKSGTTGHCSCCSSALLLLLKYTEGLEDKRLFVQDIYAEAVEDWSIKTTTKLHTVLFDDLISRFPDVARLALVPPIVKAVKEGRNPFLKSEALRLLSTLYNVGGTSTSSEPLPALSCLQSSAPDSVAAVNAALQDGELTKAKRVRDVIKACEQLVAFSMRHCLKNDTTTSTTMVTKTHPLWSNLNTTSTHLNELGEKTQSDNVKKACAKLAEDIKGALAQLPEKEVVKKDKITPAKGKKGKHKSPKKKIKEKVMITFSL